MRNILFIFLIAFSFNGYSQSGCTDVNAFNYDNLATVNDGSCLYDPIIIDPELIINELPSIVQETSGLIYFNDGYWTHNDSGGAPKIYKTDPITGYVIQTITITNGTNVDIEDITQDEDYIYVGDFGNNYGNRDDLTIYKLNKSDIPSEESSSVQAEVIEFSYNDQEDFSSRNRNNDYDCESMMSFGDYLYVFTKNWANNDTRSYKIPKDAGDYGVDVHGSFNARGLLTGADYNIEKNALVLIGYENFVPFMWIIWDFKEDKFFSGHKKRVDFANISGAQTEGICFINKDEVVISCEKSYYPPQLYQLNIQTIISGLDEFERFSPFKIVLSPNPSQQEVNITIDGLKVGKFDVEVYNLQWHKVSQYYFIEENTSNTVKVTIPTADLPKGIYFVKIKEGKNVGFQKLMTL
ncbi:MAG: T9SS type A sorting domain-containing protein [Bacteroidales bacterium]|nr:T9SS type A sorting domain-containing protein [Bacteroidales bacterium]